MKRSSVVLILLLVLDMMTTVYLLSSVPNAVEINPFLNRFSNVVLAVLISHVLAILIVLAIDVQIDRVKSRDRVKLEIFMTLVIFFYLSVVILNFLNIIFSYYNMV